MESAAEECGANVTPASESAPSQAPVARGAEPGPEAEAAPWAQDEAPRAAEEHGYLADPARDDLDYWEDSEDLVVYELSPDPTALRAAGGRACGGIFSSLEAASTDEILLEDATSLAFEDAVWRQEPPQEWSPLASALFPDAVRSPVKDSAEPAASPVRERAAQAVRRALHVMSAAYQDAASVYLDLESCHREVREEGRGLSESPCQTVRRMSMEIAHSDPVVRSIDFVKIRADAARCAAEEAARSAADAAKLREVREAAHQAKDKAELLGGRMKEKAVGVQAKLCDAVVTAKAKADVAREAAEALSAKAEQRAKHVAFRAEVALDSLGAKCAQLHTEVTRKVHKAEEIASEVSVQVAPVIEKAKCHAGAAKSVSVAVTAQVSETAQKGFGVAVEKAKVVRQASTRLLSSPGGA